MKTILVIYTNVPVDINSVNKTKRYAFNTEQEVEIGDMLESPSYDTKMQVVKILDTSFTYYNPANGEMSDNFNSSLQWEIRELNINDKPNALVVQAYRVEKK